MRVLRLLALSLLFLPGNAYGQQKPNIVLVLMDNLGWGEPGVYGGGILRGAPTPRIDQLAAEGMRLLNFNVEAQCTPSRAALMTGRYAISTGNGSVPIDTPVYGLVQWEITMAEMLPDAGYATGIFGKWHLGHTEGRFPTGQGFDEWYGIPNSTDEAFWPDNTRFRPNSDPYARPEYIMESRKGEAPKNVRIYNLEERRLIDTQLTKRALDFMDRQTKANKPFFAYIPYTLPHFPTVPSPEFQNKTHNGDFADVLAEIDAHVGQLLDAVNKLGIRDNTMFIFTSDNGAEFSTPYYGFSGPWHGPYFASAEKLQNPTSRVSSRLVRRSHATSSLIHDRRVLDAQNRRGQISRRLHPTASILGIQAYISRGLCLRFGCYLTPTMAFGVLIVNESDHHACNGPTVSLLENSILTVDVE